MCCLGGVDPALILINHVSGVLLSFVPRRAHMLHVRTVVPFSDGERAQPIDPFYPSANVPGPILLRPRCARGYAFFLFHPTWLRENRYTP